MTPAKPTGEDISDLAAMGPLRMSSCAACVAWLNSGAKRTAFRGERELARRHHALLAAKEEELRSEVWKHLTLYKENARLKGLLEEWVSWWGEPRADPAFYAPFDWIPRARRALSDSQSTDSTQSDRLRSKAPGGVGICLDGVGGDLERPIENVGGRPVSTGASVGYDSRSAPAGTGVEQVGSRSSAQRQPPARGVSPATAPKAGAEKP